MTQQEYLNKTVHYFIEKKMRNNVTHYLFSAPTPKLSGRNRQVKGESKCLAEACVN